jgi:hypothetical protein
MPSIASPPRQGSVPQVPALRRRVCVSAVTFTPQGEKQGRGQFPQILAR